MPKSNKKQREKMKAAAAYMADYVSTYSNQCEVETYSEATYIDDILYGLGVSLDKKNEWAGGFEGFKERLRRHLRSSDAGQDVSAVAKTYGGGWHLNAAGFQVAHSHALGSNTEQRGKTMRLHEKHIQWLTHLADGPKERKGWWQYPIQCARAGLTKFVDPGAGDWREELTDLGREKLSERQPND